MYVYCQTEEQGMYYIEIIIMYSVLHAFALVVIIYSTGYIL